MPGHRKELGVHHDARLVSEFFELDWVLAREVELLNRHLAVLPLALLTKRTCIASSESALLRKVY